MEANPLRINNVVLYSKGWYKKSGNLIEDLIKMLHKDDYICCSSKSAVYNILKIQFNRWNEWMRENGKSYYTIERFMDKIDDQFQYARYGNETIDYVDAAIRAMLSIFQFTSKDDVTIICPHYDRVYRPGEQIEWYKPGCTYKYANARAERYFNR